MQNKGYIYSVGKPDLGAESIEKCKKRGYKTGLLLDKNIQPPKSAELYDRVELVDFSNIDPELERLASLDLNLKGLLCTYENYLVAKAKIGKFFQAPSLTLSSAKTCTDKFLMRQAFAAYNPSLSPKFTTVTSEKELLEFAQKANYPLILKPTNLVKSLLVLTCRNESELLHNYNFAVKEINRLYEKYNIYEREPQLIVEEFITGQMYSVAAYVDVNGRPHFCPGIVKLKTAQQRGVDDNYLYERQLPANMPKDLEEKLFDAATQGILALEMSSSPAHVELIVDAEESVKIIEIGARTGGYRPRMYKLSYGTDLVDAEIALSLGQEPNLSGKLSSYTSVFEFFPKSAGSFNGMSAEAPSDIFYYSVKPSAGDTVGPAKDGFKAAAIAIVSHSDESTYLEQRAAVEKLEVKLA